MHQTFYIDVDEEITSVVERLRKARAHEIIMVVPKRALLIQSIVNLRLLKKEAEGLGLQLMIVTQDKLGKLLVEKAGILVQQKLDDNMEEEVVLSNNSIRNDAQEGAETAVRNDINIKKRFEHLGSESYFDSAPPKEKSVPRKIVRSEEAEVSESIINKELVTGIGRDIRKKAVKHIQEIVPASPVAPRMEMEREQVREASPVPVIARQNRPVPPSQEKINNFFHNNHYSNPDEQEEVVKERNYSGFLKLYWGKMKSLAFLILIAAAVISLGYGAYVLVPKATIILSIKEKNKSQDFEVRGDVLAAGVDVEKPVIPAKLVSVTNDISMKIETTGGKSISNQKARGEITIYNEFSSSPQPLVATTRFIDESGKLFRLVNGVTVPGSTQENGTTKPGQITATIAADQAGEEFNIGPAKFSIPGFKDSGADKYNKIYAVSSGAMTGGGKNNDQVRTISETDIANAKNKVSAEVEKSMVEKIKGEAGSNAVVLEEAINSEEMTYKISGSAGDVADSFQIAGSKKASALVFNEDDLKSAVSKMMAKSGGSKVKIDGSSIVFEYAKANADFKANVMDIKGHALSRLDPDINLSDFKNEILGKTSEEFESILAGYNDVEKAEIRFWPPFVSGKIPTYAKRVEIIIGEAGSE